MSQNQGTYPKPVRYYSSVEEVQNANKRELSLVERIAVIELYEQEGSPSSAKLAKKFNVSRSQILNIIRFKEDYLRQWNQNPDISRVRRSPTPQARALAIITYYFYIKCKASHNIVTEFSIKYIAATIAKILDIKNFRASNRWFERLSRKYKFDLDNDTPENRKMAFNTTQLFKIEDLIIEYRNELPEEVQSTLDDLQIFKNEEVIKEIELKSLMEVDMGHNKSHKNSASNKSSTSIKSSTSNKSSPSRKSLPSKKSLSRDKSSTSKKSLSRDKSSTSNNLPTINNVFGKPNVNSIKKLVEGQEKLIAELQKHLTNPQKVQKIIEFELAKIAREINPEFQAIGVITFIYYLKCRQYGYETTNDVIKYAAHTTAQLLNITAFFTDKDSNWFERFRFKYKLKIICSNKTALIKTARAAIQTFKVEDIIREYKTRLPNSIQKNIYFDSSGITTKPVNIISNIKTYENKKLSVNNNNNYTNNDTKINKHNMSNSDIISIEQEIDSVDLETDFASTISTSEIDEITINSKNASSDNNQINIDDYDSLLPLDVWYEPFQNLDFLDISPRSLSSKNINEIDKNENLSNNNIANGNKFEKEKQQVQFIKSKNNDQNNIKETAEKQLELLKFKNNKSNNNDISNNKNNNKNNNNSNKVEKEKRIQFIKVKSNNNNTIIEKDKKLKIVNVIRTNKYLSEKKLKTTNVKSTNNNQNNKEKDLKIVSVKSYHNQKMVEQKPITFLHVKPSNNKNEKDRLLQYTNKKIIGKELNKESLNNIYQKESIEENINNTETVEEQTVTKENIATNEENIHCNEEKKLQNENTQNKEVNEEKITKEIDKIIKKEKDTANEDIEINGNLQIDEEIQMNEDIQINDKIQNNEIVAINDKTQNKEESQMNKDIVKEIDRIFEEVLNEELIELNEELIELNEENNDGNDQVIENVDEMINEQVNMLSGEIDVYEVKNIRNEDVLQNNKTISEKEIDNDPENISNKTLGTAKKRKFEETLDVNSTTKNTSEYEEQIKKSKSSEQTITETENETRSFENIVLKNEEEVLKYLKPLEEYALLTSNFRAINYVTCLEDIFKKHQKE